MSQDIRSHRRKSQGLGSITSVVEAAQGFAITTQNGWIRIAVWETGMVRIIAGLGPLAMVDDFSYAVVGHASHVNVQLHEATDRWVLRTASLQVEVIKNPLLIRLLDLEGNVIQEDDVLGISWLGQEATTYKRLQPNERFLGLGEKTGPLDKRGRAYVNWNTDHFGYGPESDPLYASIPFFIGVHAHGAYGFFLDNSYKTTFNFGASSDRFAWYAVDDGQMDYFLIHYPTVPQILSAYGRLTGFMPLPPKWALGFQQCRYSYYPDAEVLRIAQTFREKQIPADVIYLDIHYMDAFKVFTWHKSYFPDPKRLCTQLAELGFKVVLIVDPGIKVEPGYAAYDTGLAGDHFAKLPDGEPYKGQVWPGWSHFPDFTSAETRAWWGAQLAAYTDAGIEGFWNDMNEPAAWGQHLPNAIEFDFEGHGSSFKEARNVYGMEMARATLEGAERLLPGRRIFNLTRAGFAGIQRYAAVWTGDNTASEAHMLAGQRLVTSLGLSGVAFSGYDIGGFVGEPSPALYARWMALGAFTPFFRAHSMINSRDAEPWSFGEEVEDIARNYIRLRYRLMPYLYSAFREASTTGIPIARSLAIDWPQDPKVYQSPYDNSFLFGPAILVVPVESHHSLSKIYLPAGEWFDAFEDRHFPGGEHIVALSPERLPLFVKAGAVIAMQSPVQTTAAPHSGVLHLHVYAGGTDYVTEWYDDDGATQAHERGVYARRTVMHHAAERRLLIGAQEGSYASAFGRIRLHFHGNKRLESVIVNGNKMSVGHEEFRLVEPVSRFDPFMPAVSEAVAVADLPFAEIEFLASAIEVKY